MAVFFPNLGFVGLIRASSHTCMDSFVELHCFQNFMDFELDFHGVFGVGLECGCVGEWLECVWHPFTKKASEYSDLRMHALN